MHDPVKESWLRANGNLELKEYLDESGYTGIWMANGGALFRTSDYYPVDDLYKQVNHHTWLHTITLSKNKKRAAK